MENKGWMSLVEVENAVGYLGVTYLLSHKAVGVWFLGVVPPLKTTPPPIPAEKAEQLRCNNDKIPAMDLSRDVRIIINFH